MTRTPKRPSGTVSVVRRVRRVASEMMIAGIIRAPRVRPPLRALFINDPRDARFASVIIITTEAPQRRPRFDISNSRRYAAALGVAK